MPNLGLTWFRPTSNAKVSYLESSILSGAFWLEKCEF